MSSGRTFNPPPGWPQPPPGWSPPSGWTPDPSWPPMPEGWQLWLEEAAPEEANDEDTSKSAAAAQNVDGSVPSEERAEALHTAAPLSSVIQDSAVELDDEIVLQSVGIYRYHHPLEHAVAYKERLDALSSEIADLVKSGRAIEASNMFTFDNSLAKGRKMTSDLSKLMLRAYNAEAENSIRTLRVGNVVTAKKRIDRSRMSIAKLGQMMEMHISDEFHDLRIQEIELTADWLMKKQEEKEEAREERARLREQKKVEAELKAQREGLDKEREHLLRAIAASESEGPETLELRSRLSELDEAIEQNDFRSANIRAGYVYVISNRGAFGEGVVKIGLTRRLEPLDRVRELGGASVPFQFDVHALFFSEDAVGLETALHQHFADRKVNQANTRKEFFFASPSEVRDVLAEHVGSLLEFNEHADATEFHQSLSSWPADRAALI